MLNGALLIAAILPSGPLHANGHRISVTWIWITWNPAFVQSAHNISHKRRGAPSFCDRISFQWLTGWGGVEWACKWSLNLWLKSHTCTRVIWTFHCGWSLFASMGPHQWRRLGNSIYFNLCLGRQETSSVLRLTHIASLEFNSMV